MRAVFHIETNAQFLKTKLSAIMKYWLKKLLEENVPETAVCNQCYLSLCHTAKSCDVITGNI